MKALITGVTGFAGSFLAEHLLEQGDQVLGAANQAQWPRGMNYAAAEQIALLTWDITRPPPDDVRREIQRFEPDCIFHLAGLSVPSDCGETQPSTAAQAVNVEGVRQAIFLTQRLPRSPRLTFVSSCRVYAPVTSSDPFVDEQATIAPEGAYGKTKWEAEQLIEGAREDEGLDAVIIRAFNHTGPRQAPRMMLSEWASQLARGVSTLDVVSRDSHLDLSDVRDVVRAYRELAHSAPAGVYNVGSGVSLRSGDVLETLLRRYDAPVTVRERSPGRTQLPIAKLDRLQRAIDWAPSIPIEQTVEDTLTYWMEQSR